jgi:hypothetical protein
MEREETVTSCYRTLAEKLILISTVMGTYKTQSKYTLE